jgi:hypothetical protein
LDDYFGAIHDSTLLAALDQYENPYNNISDEALLQAATPFDINYLQDIDNSLLLDAIRPHERVIRPLLPHLEGHKPRVGRLHGVNAKAGPLECNSYSAVKLHHIKAKKQREEAERQAYYDTLHKFRILKYNKVIRVNSHDHYARSLISQSDWFVFMRYENIWLEGEPLDPDSLSHIPISHWFNLPEEVEDPDYLESLKYVPLVPFKS